VKDRADPRLQIFDLISKANTLIPETLIDLLPSSKGLGGEPEWHNFDLAVWEVGERIRQLQVKT
jgi:hypothetical protein